MGIGTRHKIVNKGVGVGMLRVWRISFLVYWFLGFLVSWCLSFLVSWIHTIIGFLVSKFQSFKDSKIIWYLLEDIDPILPNSHFMFSGRY